MAFTPLLLLALDTLVIADGRVVRIEPAGRRASPSWFPGTLCTASSML